MPPPKRVPNEGIDIQESPFLAWAIVDIDLSPWLNRLMPAWAGLLVSRMRPPMPGPGSTVPFRRCRAPPSVQLFAYLEMHPMPVPELSERGSVFVDFLLRLELPIGKVCSSRPWPNAPSVVRPAAPLLGRDADGSVAGISDEYKRRVEDGTDWREHRRQTGTNQGRNSTRVDIRNLVPAGSDNAGCLVLASVKAGEMSSSRQLCLFVPVYGGPITYIRTHRQKQVGTSDDGLCLTAARCRGGGGLRDSGAIDFGWVTGRNPMIYAGLTNGKTRDSLSWIVRVGVEGSFVGFRRLARYTIKLRLDRRVEVECEEREKYLHRGSRGAAGCCCCSWCCRHHALPEASMACT
jgi:hypothetical protein